MTTRGSSCWTLQCGLKLEKGGGRLGQSAPLSLPLFACSHVGDTGFHIAPLLETESSPEYRYRPRLKFLDIEGCLTFLPQDALSPRLEHLQKEPQVAFQFEA